MHLQRCCFAILNMLIFLPFSFNFRRSLISRPFDGHPTNYDFRVFKSFGISRITVHSVLWDIRKVASTPCTSYPNTSFISAGIASHYENLIPPYSLSLKNQQCGKFWAWFAPNARGLYEDITKKHHHRPIDDRINVVPLFTSKRNSRRQIAWPQLRSRRVVSDYYCTLYSSLFRSLRFRNLCTDWMSSISSRQLVRW